MFSAGAESEETRAAKANKEVIKALLSKEAYKQLKQHVDNGALAKYPKSTAQRRAYRQALFNKYLRRLLRGNFNHSMLRAIFRENAECVQRSLLAYLQGEHVAVDELTLKHERHFYDTRVEIARHVYCMSYSKAQNGKRSVIVKRFDSEYVVNAALDEMAMHRGLHHRNIAQFLGALSSSVGFVIDGAKMRLSRAIKISKGGISWEKRGAKIIYDISKALAYLKKKRIIHFNVNPKNILLTSQGRAMLADVESAARLRPDQESTEFYAGARNFAAPEILFKTMRYTCHWFDYGGLKYEDAPITYAADVYALGCTLFEMASRKRMWLDTEPSFTMESSVLNAIHPDTSNIDPKPREWIERLWPYWYEARPEIEDVRDELREECLKIGAIKLRR